MPTGRRHLDRPTTHPLALHVGQVRHRHFRIHRPTPHRDSERAHGTQAPRRPRSRRRRPGLHPAQQAHQVAQRSHPRHRVGADECRLVGVGLGHHHPTGAGGTGQGEHPGDVPQRAVQPQLPDEGRPGHQTRRQRAGGHQQTDGDGQVESGSPLAHS